MPGAPRIVDEVLRELRRGVSPLECAMRFSIDQSTVRRYRSGKSQGRSRGRPRALTATQERVCFRCWSLGEATMYELATIYQVTPRTMRNVLQRQLSAGQQTSIWWS